jgi:Zn-dependent protease
MFSFTNTEKRELLLGTFIFVLVELSLYISPFQFIEFIMIDLTNDFSFFLNELFILFVLCILSIPLFLFHELSHKFAAQGYGLHSGFRLDPNFALFSLFSIFLPIKIIAPGVVLSSGDYRLDKSARISMAGPLINILIGGIFLAFSAFISLDWFLVILLLVSKFSFDLALFNMLPFSVLDGAKVFSWNQPIFALIFILSLVLWLFHPLGIFGGSIIV